MFLAKKIIDEIWDLNIKHEFSSGRGRVTVSIGVATLTPTIETKPQKLIDLADNKMYDAKHNGRNRFVSSIN